MKTVTLKFYKSDIHDYIDSITFKRVDASLDQSSDRAQNAVSSDSEEGIDGVLIDEFSSRRDATLRARLKFCIISDTESDNMVFDNRNSKPEYYEFKLKVEDNFSAAELQSIGTKMDEYIKRGTLLSWYLHSGIEPTDTEAALSELEDSIVYGLRGQAWGHRPMQPFGPAQWNYYKKGL